jgi:hypothetical protein
MSICKGCGKESATMVSPVVEFGQTAKCYYCPECAAAIDRAVHNGAIGSEVWTNANSLYYHVMPLDGWHCPRCNRINAPSVLQCPCSPPHESHAAFDAGDQPSVPTPEVAQ